MIVDYEFNDGTKRTSTPYSDYSLSDASGNPSALSNTRVYSLSKGMTPEEMEKLMRVIVRNPSVSAACTPDSACWVSYALTMLGKVLAYLPKMALKA